jgi:hypothetical protein
MAILTMAKLGYLVLQLSEGIGDAEVRDNRQRAVELWGQLERAVDQARNMDKPSSGITRDIIDWSEGKIYVFTLALQPRSTRYATSEWRSMIEKELAQAQEDNAKWQASRRQASADRTG